MKHATNDSSSLIKASLALLDKEEQEELFAVWKLASPSDFAGADPDRVSHVAQQLQKLYVEPARPQSIAFPWFADFATKLAGKRFVMASVVLGIALIALLVISTVRIENTSTLPKTVTLYEGSTVMLNQHARISYTRWFHFKTRRFRFDGDGYFVVSAMKYPFIVQTAHGEIRVQGTRFRVRTWEKDGTEVYLAEGQVTVKTNRASLTLRPGEVVRLTHDHTELISRDVTQRDLPDWIRQRVAFRESDTLGQIIEEIELLYGVTISIQTPEVLEQPIGFNMTANAPISVYEFLDDLQRITGLAYRPTKNGFEIFEE